MKSLNKIVSFGILAFVQLVTYAKPPNDKCSTAITLSCGTSNLAGTTASSSNIASGTGCTVSNYGVWYTFVGDGQSTTISSTAAAGYDHELDIASGSCGSLTSVACIDGSGSGGTESYTFTSTVGVTYFVYIAHWSSTSSTTGDFTISRTCVAAPAGPLNDECSGATALTVNPDQLCGTTTSGTVENATASGDANSCFGTDDDDVWYSFVATGSVHTIDLLNVVGSVTDMYHSVFTGTCGSLGTAVSCSDPNSSTVTGLTAGQTYYVRVYTYTSTTGQNTTFDICVGTPPPPPANDECSGATALTVNPDQSCGTTTAGTISSATPSADANSCFGTDDDDVWYSFVATGSVHTIDLLNVVGSVTDMYHSVFTGTCGSLGTAVSCSDPNSSTVTGLTAGQTYYVRVYTYTSTTGQNTTFDICVGTPPPPPANDECSGATALTVNPDGLCGTTTAGTISSATPSADANSCFGTDDDDVWYSFVATGATHYIELLNVVGSVTDMYHSVFTGTCGSLGTAVSCSDPNSSTVTGLTAGQTYYVRVYTYTSTTGQSVTFDICVGSPPPPPTNDECAGAILAAVNSTSVCTSVTSGWTVGATQTLAGCVGTAQDDVWFSFVALDANQDISILNATGTTDLVHELFSGTCGSLTSIGCSDPNTSSYTGLTVGTTYFVRVYTYSSTGSNTGFDLCITSPCGIGGAAPTCNLDYTMATIAHAPYSYATGTALTFTDDKFANNYSAIGFNFCFDGISYTDVLVSSNGYLIFPSCYSSVPGGAGVPGGSSPWTISAAIPNNTNAPTNAIMLWNDIDPSVSGTIRTNIEGVTPNRVFVAKYDNIAMFSSSCNAQKYNVQIMLYETTNDIEIHVTEKTICATWNSGYGILGLHNFDGTIAVTNAGHNHPTNWAESNVAYKFTNNCAPCSVVLPIELLSFTGENNGDVNELKWVTASEINNDYFVIESSVDNHFKEIGVIAGAGTSANTLTYNFTDKNPLGDLVYYRLKQVDFNGDFKYSNIIAVKSQNATEVNIYPNPAADNLFFDINTSQEKTYTIVYTSIVGSVSKEQIKVSKGKNIYQAANFDLLGSGIYFIQILNDDNEVVISQKIVKE